MKGAGEIVASPFVGMNGLRGLLYISIGGYMSGLARPWRFLFGWICKGLASRASLAAWWLVTILLHRVGNLLIGREGGLLRLFPSGSGFDFGDVGSQSSGRVAVVTTGQQG